MMQHVRECEKGTYFSKEWFDFEADVDEVFDEEYICVNAECDAVVVYLGEKVQVAVDEDELLAKLSKYYGVKVNHLLRLGDYSDKHVIVFYEE